MQFQLHQILLYYLLLIKTKWKKNKKESNFKEKVEKYFPSLKNNLNKLK